MKNKIKLEWKQEWSDDNSGYWYVAKVPIIGWDYIIDVYESSVFEVGVFFSKHADDLTFFTNRSYKKLESAMDACEKHLHKSMEQFKKLSS